MGNGRSKVSIEYVGMSPVSEFSDKPPVAPRGETVTKMLTVDEYSVEITAPEEAATRFKGWIQAVKKQADYRDILIPTFKLSRTIQFPLIGEELWYVSLATATN
jgi:hypothetical protein